MRSLPAVSRIRTTLARLHAAGRLAPIPYITVDYPDVETIVELPAALVEAGADLI